MGMKMAVPLRHAGSAMEGFAWNLMRIENWARRWIPERHLKQQPPPNFRWLTPKEMQSYKAKLMKSQGFDVDDFPHADGHLVRPAGPGLFDPALYDHLLQLAVANYTANQDTVICKPRLLKSNCECCGVGYFHYMTFEALDRATDHFGPVSNIKIQALKQLPAPTSSRSQDDSSSSSSMNGKEAKHSQEDEQSSPLYPHCSSGVSPDSGTGRNSSWNGSLSLTEYKVYKNDGLADASTQTKDNVRSSKTRETCTRGVSTDDGSLDNEGGEASQSKASAVKENSEVRSESVSPQPTSSSASSSGGKNETLESLIRADASKMNSFRILKGGDVRMPADARLKATNMLMQLISCGSISVKDNSFGLTNNVCLSE
ncbi:hypothetical protein CDL15_Pgr025115 [Punica granatum]|uniref:Uncharacterized protein n=1 Tax=Punica granatum TaxID=22663 RepID=A0A218W8W6_PUNGR|nr:hypothetical protein CDL15_Pgr025115 [Punica granatum]